MVRFVLFKSFGFFDELLVFELLLNVFGLIPDDFKTNFKVIEGEPLLVTVFGAAHG